MLTIIGYILLVVYLLGVGYFLQHALRHRYYEGSNLAAIMLWPIVAVAVWMLARGGMMKL